MSDIGGQAERRVGGSGPEGRPEHIDEGPLAEGAPPDTDPTPQLGDTPPAGVPLVGAPGPDRTSRRRRWIIGTLALLVAVAIAVIMVIVLTSGGPRFRVTRISNQLHTYVERGHKVTFIGIVVLNTGTETGTPTCVIYPTVPGTGLKKSTITESSPIKPGGGKIYINPLSIPPASAHLLKRSDITVTCH